MLHFVNKLRNFLLFEQTKRMRIVHFNQSNRLVNRTGMAMFIFGLTNSPSYIKITGQ